MNTDTYRTIACILDQLVQMPDPQPSLADLANSVGLSEFHFQRLFKDWVGVSPKKFIQHLTLEAAKERLRASTNVLDASYDAGLSGPGRLHDLMINMEAMTPGEYKKGGDGLTIYHGHHDTPFGVCDLFMTERGVCGLEFPETDKSPRATFGRWPNAVFVDDPLKTQPCVDQIFNDNPVVDNPGTLSVYVEGSKFQLQVWKALLSIPSGTLSTYGNIAEGLDMGRQGARAVGGAVGANPIGWLIPCHRVIRASGAISGYRWGETRKLAMLGWEATRNKEPRIQKRAARLSASPSAHT
jgi:AraC family transcriptional regulator of adaptative response/methylated-DNA-[protein]-cysteine methyltransferase